jgi:transposase
MQTVTTIGFDIAKSVFQVHGVDAAGQVVIRRQLRRRSILSFFQKLPSCLIGIEACASSHYWSRELQALGHTVRLMPPAYVKPYIKRQKNDAADAEAICEAVTRPSMRFVETKTPEQQSCLMLHRTRHLFIRQQTAVINAIRAHLAEFGIVAPVGRNGVEQLLGVVADPNDKRVERPSEPALQGEHDRLERRSVAAARELEQVSDELRLDRRRTALQLRCVVLAQCFAVDADDVRDLVLRDSEPGQHLDHLAAAVVGPVPRSAALVPWFHAVRHYEIARRSTASAGKFDFSSRTGKTP